MKKLFTFLLLFIFITSVKAYENKYFKISIPEGYQEELKEDNMFKWTKDNKFIAITVAPNENYDINKTDEVSIQEEKAYIEKSINEGLAKYNVESSVINIKKDDSDKYSFIEYDIYYPSEDATGYNTYQKGRTYTTLNYIYTIMFSSDTPLDNNEEYKSVLNSIELYDQVIQKDNKTIDNKIYIFLVFVIIVLLVVYKYIKQNKKHQ